MICIQKEYHFSAAHLLPNHGGQCARLHGHNYKVVVEVLGNINTLGGYSDGMVLDFHDLDDILKSVIEPMDHRFLAKGDEWPWEVAMRGAKGGPDSPLGQEMYYVGVRTTAELLVVYIAEKIQEELPAAIELVFIELWETPKACARYIP